jgi:hypothetical protein
MLALAYLPIMLGTLASATVALTTAEAVATAPDPSIARVVDLDTGLAVATAPDVVPPGGTIELAALTIVATAPSPTRTGEDILGIDTGEVVLTAPDITVRAPRTVTMDSGLIAVTAPNPLVTYTFVTVQRTNTYKAVPVTSTQEAEHRRQTATVVNRALEGKLNCIGRVTLLPNVPLTPLRDPLLTPDSIVFFDPLTANAVAEWAAGTMYVLAVNRTGGQFLITHANGATADRTFGYVVLG